MSAVAELTIQTMLSIENSVAINVPQEVLIEIFSTFHNRCAALKACSLVNKAWMHASRVVLFRSVNLTPLLAQKDWLSVFMRVPLDIGDHAREIVVKNARWAAESSRIRVLLLSNFATSATTLKLSNLTISDFADFTHIVSILKRLDMLSIQHVGFEYNTLNLSDSIPPNRSIPPTLSSLYLYHVDLGLLFGWFLGHDAVPKLSRAYFGPLESSWKTKAQQFLNHNVFNLSEVSFLFADTAVTPYTSYCAASIKQNRLLPAAADLQHLMDKYQTRYGIQLILAGLPLGENFRILRVHRFFYGKSRLMAIRSVWAARLLVNVQQGFRGRVILDVDISSVREINELEIDWEFLEDMFSVGVFCEMEAVVFLVLTNISIASLESLIALKMPRSYARGILRFEEAHETTIRPVDIL